MGFSINNDSNKSSSSEIRQKLFFVTKVIEKEIKFLNKKRVILLILILLGALISLIGYYSYNKNQFLKENGLIINLTRIPTYDGHHISAYYIMPEYVKNINNSSIPLIIVVHGINENKEAHLEKGYNFAKHGYVCIIIDQRGHGMSDVQSSLGFFEVFDISAVIDWADLNLKMINSSNIGLVGASFGGMVSLIAQTLDNRIKATVTLSAPSNITKVLDTLNIDELIASNIRDFFYGYNLEIRNPLKHVSENNTDNLLMIQGTADDVVLPEHCVELYNQINGSNRDSVQYILRDGLSHPGNIFNKENIKYTIFWFDHFLKNQNTSLSNLESNPIISNIELIQNIYHANKTALMSVLISICVFIFFLMRSLFIPYLEKDKYFERKILELNETEESCPMMQPKQHIKIISTLFIIYILSYILAGISGFKFNLSVVETYQILPIAFGLVPFILFIKKTNAFYCGVWHMINLKMDLGLNNIYRSIIYTSVPFFLFIYCCNQICGYLLLPEYAIFNVTFLYYVFSYSISIYYDIFFIKTLENLSGSKSKQFFKKHEIIILTFIKTLFSIYIFLLFPIEYFMNYRIPLNFILISATIISVVIILYSIKFAVKINHNITAAVILIGAIIATFLCYRVVRVF
ncbi:MAG: alpha/beta hydrolase family protein [Promethearchaeota archaeon]